MKETQLQASARMVTSPPPPLIIVGGLLFCDRCLRVFGATRLKAFLAHKPQCERIPPVERDFEIVRV